MLKGTQSYPVLFGAAIARIFADAQVYLQDSYLRWQALPWEWWTAAKVDMYPHWYNDEFDDAWLHDTEKWLEETIANGGIWAYKDENYRACMRSYKMQL